MSLVVENLCRSFTMPSGTLEILRGVNLQLQPGEALAIVGPSGSGKSTLLQILGTLDQPTLGTVLLHGQNPFSLNPTALAEFRNRQIGFIFQDHHLLPQCNVLENVLLPTFAGNGVEDPKQAEAYARELLEKVGLAERIEHMPAELSGGERQRVAIARALVMKPKLLLADEPTGNLDRTNAAAIAELLVQLPQKEQMIQIIVTHSLDLAAKLPRCLEMDQGCLVARLA